MFRSAIAASAAIVLSAAGCGAGTSDARAPQRALPAYGDHQAELFDDAIESEAIGSDLAASPSLANSALFRERTLEGDAVVRARVTTITSKAQDNGYGWQVGLHTVERIAGNGPLATDFMIQVDSNGPAAGMLRAFESTLVGTTFLAFAREFARPGSPAEADLHFHLAQYAKVGVDAVG